jgi:hypothetical protein
VILQARGSIGVLGRQEIGSCGEQLTELDEGRAERLEIAREFISASRRRGAVFVGRASASRRARILRQEPDEFDVAAEAVG